MPCDINKIDSNVSNLAYAEEECLNQLPGEEGADAVWYNLEPNSYSDFGGDLKTVARAPISQSRQNKKGAVVDLDANGGFNSDFTQTNLTRLLQGFFFADAREKPTTQSLIAAGIDVTSVTASSKTYTTGTGVLPFNKAGYLVNASNYLNSANNGLKTVVSATATTIVVSETLADEASPPVNAKMSVVGYQGASADLSIAVTSGIPSLISSALDFTTLGLIVGEWVFIGGDLTAQKFANNVGFARIGTISANALIFDDVSWAPVTEAGTGKTIRLFFGTVIKNENTPSLIKRRSYNIERQLGEGEVSTQAEYLEGAVANEMTLNLPLSDKINVDLSFIAANNVQVTGEVGDELKDGVRVAAPGEDAYNTSSDLYRVKLAILDPATANPSSLFGFVSEGNLSISNGVTPNKALGVLGAFDTTAANFVVSGSLTAYFSTVEAVRAVRRNADVGFSVIAAAKNAGFIFDIPLLGLGGGRLSVEKDQPIKVPVTPEAAENKNGYTLLHNVFSYLPTIAMP